MYLIIFQFKMEFDIVTEILENCVSHLDAYCDELHVAVQSTVNMKVMLALILLDENLLFRLPL